MPNQREAFFVRNLHAHACVGILLTWGVVGQTGVGHINNHDPEYVMNTFVGLGYVYDAPLADLLLNASGRAYRALHVFRRRQPPVGGGCDPE